MFVKQEMLKDYIKLARKGIIKQFTGISDPFENPINADLEIDSNNNTNINQLLNKIVNILN